MPAIRGSSRIFPVGGASSITGPRGISGPTGATGATGPVGDTGPLGVMGTYIVATGASGGPGNSYGNDFITFFLSGGTTIGVSGAAGNIGNAQSTNTSYRIVNDSEALEHGQLRKLIDGSTAEFYSFTISGKDISARYEGDTIIFHGATYDFGVLGNTGEFVVGVSADGAKNTHYDGDTLLMRILNHREIFDSANDNTNDDITTKPILTDTIVNPNKIHGTSIPFLRKQNPENIGPIVIGAPGNTAFHSGLYLGQKTDDATTGVYYEFPGVTFSGDYGDGNIIGAFGSCCYCSDGDEGEESHTKDCINYVTEEYCNTVDGIFSSLECLKSGCFDSGSCCVNGDCVASTEETCEKYGGFYIDNLTCSEVNDIGGCPASCGFGGACCVGGVCIDADELACDFENGVFFPETSCASIVPEFNGTPLEGTTYTEFCCDQECRGACCLEEICYDTTAVQCAALINENAGAEGEAQGESKGVFWGVGSVCAGPDGPYLWNNDPLERNGWFQTTVEIEGLDNVCLTSTCACECYNSGDPYNPYGIGTGSLGYIDYILNETNGCLPPDYDSPECLLDSDCDGGFCCDDGTCVDGIANPEACESGGFDCRVPGVGCNCEEACCNQDTGQCDAGPCACSNKDDCDSPCCCVDGVCGECPSCVGGGCPDGQCCVDGVCGECEICSCKWVGSPGDPLDWVCTSSGVPGDPNGGLCAAAGRCCYVNLSDEQGCGNVATCPNCSFSTTFDAWFCAGTCEDCPDEDPCECIDETDCKECPDKPFCGSDGECTGGLSGKSGSCCLWCNEFDPRACKILGEDPNNSATNQPVCIPSGGIDPNGDPYAGGEQQCIDLGGHWSGEGMPMCGENGTCMRGSCSVSYGPSSTICRPGGDGCNGCYNTIKPQCRYVEKKVFTELYNFAIIPDNDIPLGALHGLADNYAWNPQKCCEAATCGLGIVQATPVGLTDGEPPAGECYPDRSNFIRGSFSESWGSWLAEQFPLDLSINWSNHLPYDFSLNYAACGQSKCLQWSEGENDPVCYPDHPQYPYGWENLCYSGAGRGYGDRANGDGSFWQKRGAPCWKCFSQCHCASRFSDPDCPYAYEAGILGGGLQGFCLNPNGNNEYDIQNDGACNTEGSGDETEISCYYKCDPTTDPDNCVGKRTEGRFCAEGAWDPVTMNCTDIVNRDGWVWWETDFSDNVCSGELCTVDTDCDQSGGGCSCIDGSCTLPGEDQEGICCKAGFDPRFGTYEYSATSASCNWWKYRVSQGGSFGGGTDWVCSGPPSLLCGCFADGCENPCIDDFGQCTGDCLSTTCEEDITSVSGGRCGWLSNWGYGTNGFCGHGGICNGCQVCAYGGSGFAGDEQQYPEQQNFNVAGNDEPQPPQIPSGGESGCGTIILADGTCWSCCSDSTYTGSPDGCCCVNGESTVQNEDICTGIGGYFYPVEDTNDCGNTDFCVGACCKDNIIDAEDVFCCSDDGDAETAETEPGVFACMDNTDVDDDLGNWVQDTDSCNNETQVQWCYYNTDNGQYSNTLQTPNHCLSNPDDCPWINGNSELIWSQSIDVCGDVTTDPNIESCCYCGNSPAPTADKYYRYSDCPGFDRIECVNEQVDEDCVGGIFNRDEVCEDFRCGDPFPEDVPGSCCSGPLTVPPFQCYITNNQIDCEGTAGSETGNKWGGQGTNCCVETCFNTGPDGNCCGTSDEEDNKCGDGFADNVPCCYNDGTCAEVPRVDCQLDSEGAVSGRAGELCNDTDCDSSDNCKAEPDPQCIFIKPDGTELCVPRCSVYNTDNAEDWNDFTLRYDAIDAKYKVGGEQPGWFCPIGCKGTTCPEGNGSEIYPVCPCTELRTVNDGCALTGECEPKDYKCPSITCSDTDDDEINEFCGEFCPCGTTNDVDGNPYCTPRCGDGSCPPCIPDESGQLRCMPKNPFGKLEDGALCTWQCTLGQNEYCPCISPGPTGTSCGPAYADVSTGRITCPNPGCPTTDDDTDGSPPPSLKWGGESTCINCIELHDMGACCEQDVDEGQYSRQNLIGEETMSCSCCMDLPITDCCTWWSDEIEGCVPPTDDLPENHPVGYCPHCAAGCEDNEFCNSDDFCKIDTEVSTDEYNSCSHYCHSIGGRFYGDEFSTDCSSCGNWQLRPDTDGGWCCYRNEATLQNECRKVNSPYECECTVQNGGFGGVFHKTQDECTRKCRQDSLRGSCCTLTDCQDDVDITDCIGSWKLNTPCYYRDCDVTQRNFITTCTVDTTYRTAAECDKSVNPNLTFNYGKAIEIYDVAEGGDTPNLSNNTAPLVPHQCDSDAGTCKPMCCQSGSGGGCDFDADCGGDGVCCNGRCMDTCEGESCSSSADCGGLECCGNRCQQDCGGSRCNRDGDCGFGCCVNGTCENTGECEESGCRFNTDCAGSLLCCEGECSSDCGCGGLECSSDEPYTCGRCIDLPCVNGKCIDVGACCKCSVVDGVDCEELTNEECESREGFWWPGKQCTDTVYDNFGTTIEEYCYQNFERLGLECEQEICPCQSYLGTSTSACSDCFCCIECGTDGICPDPDRGFSCEGGEQGSDEGTCCIPCHYDWWGDDAPAQCGKAFTACANAGGVITGGRCEDGCSNGTKCCDIINEDPDYEGDPGCSISSQCPNTSIPCEDDTYCPFGCNCLGGSCDCGK